MGSGRLFGREKDVRRDWAYDVILPVTGVSALLGLVIGAVIGWPEDWQNSVHRNAFWGWTVCPGLVFGVIGYISTGIVGLLRLRREL
jgi:hypothetical protein